jgi:hypothetical protein
MIMSFSPHAKLAECKCLGMCTQTSGLFSHPSPHYGAEANSPPTQAADNIPYNKQLENIFTTSSSPMLASSSGVSGGGLASGLWLRPRRDGPGRESLSAFRRATSCKNQKTG